MAERNSYRPRIKIASLNIKGRRSGDIDKWMHIPQLMRERRIGILTAQETHLTDEIAEQFETIFRDHLMLLHSPDPETRNAKGIAIVIDKRMIDVRGVNF